MCGRAIEFWGMTGNKGGHRLVPITGTPSSPLLPSFVVVLGHMVMPLSLSFSSPSFLPLEIKHRLRNCCFPILVSSPLV